MPAPGSHTKRADATVDAAVAAEGNRAASLLPILQQVQASAGHLSVNSLGALSDKLEVPEARTFGVATFYSQLSRRPLPGQMIHLCDGPVCALKGADRVRGELREATDTAAVGIGRTSCLGLCDRAPAALVNGEACGPVSTAETERICTGWRGPAPDYAQAVAGECRVAMRRIGRIDPGEIGAALKDGAYQSLADALKKSPQSVRAAVDESGLQGRGGAGFPTGRKWNLVAEAEGEDKFVVCNADESEPMTFKDRVLMEGDPHLVLEGMALAGYAVGAGHGVIYIRGEYENAAALLERAIQQAEREGWLGNSIRGTDFSFQVHLHRGSGAYICGEETALLESLEGRRGEPRVRPPYPTSNGFWGFPTLVNNVETLCKVPAILERGSRWYRSLGTTSSPGTKVFTITGHVNRPAAVEVPFGVTVRQLIQDFAGGMIDGSRFKAAVTGGAAGTIVGPAGLDVPLDFDSQKKGVSLGAGSLLIVDESVSIFQILLWLLHFFTEESCGKCTPCREGTQLCRRILRRCNSGQGTIGDLDQLKQLAKTLRLTSLCGLGQSVAWPLDSAVAHFGEELRANLVDGGSTGGDNHD